MTAIPADTEPGTGAAAAPGAARPAAGIAASWLARDLRRDWRRWSAAERIGATALMLGLAALALLLGS